MGSHIDLLLESLESGGAPAWNAWRQHNPDFIRPDLHGAKLVGKDMSHYDLSGANLKDVDLTGAILEEAVLQRAFFWKTSFVGADLNKADFRDSIICSADFSGANFELSNFEGVENSPSNWKAYAGWYSAEFKKYWNNRPHTNPVYRLRRRRVNQKILGWARTVRDSDLIVLLEAIGIASVVVTMIMLVVDLNDRKQDKVNAAWEILTRLDAPGNSGKKQALEYLHSKGVQLVGVDLSVSEGKHGTYLESLNFQGGNLTSSNLTKANLRNSNVSNSILTGANLQFADFEEANFKSVKFDNADIYCTNFVNAKGAPINWIEQTSWNSPECSAYWQANRLIYFLARENEGAEYWSDWVVDNLVLDGLNLAEISLNSANLTGLNLQGANLENASISRAYLQNTRLQNANLRNTDLQNTYFGGANFENADLQGANLSGAYLGEVSFINANLQNAVVTAYGSSSNYTNANLRQANLFDGTFTDANFQNADLSYANLEQAVFVRSNFTGANLEGAVFTNSKRLLCANFTDARHAPEDWKILTEWDSTECKEHWQNKVKLD